MRSWVTPTYSYSQVWDISDSGERLIQMDRDVKLRPVTPPGFVVFRLRNLVYIPS